MKRTVVVGAVIGIALFTGVIVWQGVGDIVQALGIAGWGLLLVTAWHLLPLAVDALAWRVLFRTPRPGFIRLTWARWIGESVNGLLPVAQIGGDVAKARLLTLRGRSGARVGASVVVDTTLAMITQILFALLGVALLLLELGSHELVPYLLLAIAAGAAMAALFFRLQLGGLFAGLARVLRRLAAGREWLDLVGGARALDAGIRAIYARRGVALHCTLWHLLGWLLGIGEVYLALYFLDAPVSLQEAALIEALAQAVRGAAFAIPAALGVQEGGYLLLGTLVGLSPDISLALALSRRVRELLLGIPGLIAWQWVEGRHAATRRRQAAGAACTR